jgi:hypothetical protein
MQKYKHSTQNEAPSIALIQKTDATLCDALSNPQ